MEGKVLAFAIGLLLVAVAQCQKTPTIGFISPDVVTDIGGDVELTCKVNDGSEYPILWMRIDKEGVSFPISTGDTLMANDKRFKLDTNDTYTLSIRDVRVTDAATYQCQVVVSMSNMITGDVKLQVKLPPTMSLEKCSKSVVGTTGKSAELTCLADGFPLPRIKWARKDGTLMPNGKRSVAGNTLKLDKLKKEDRGKYICQASNGVGKSASHIVNLDVEFSPRIEVPKPRIPQAEGYDATLTCNIFAFPRPSIHWSLDGDLMEEEDNHEVTHFTAKNEETVSTLKIFGVREDQFGMYKCEATNLYGTANETVELYKSQIPICPPVCGDIDLTSAAVTTKASFALMASVFLMTLTR